MSKKNKKQQQLRFKILQTLGWVPDSVMLPLQYWIKLKRWPNLKNPQRYTEKLQVYKMKYRNPLMTQCVDKYDVRGYVESKGLKSILNDCYGVYDKADDIKLSALPSKFVAKTTGGGGGENVMIVRDKSKIDEERFRKELNQWGSTVAANYGREWAYDGITKNRIIVEALLEDDSNSDGSIDDYKFMCFDGKFRSLWVDKNRYSDHHRGFWDENLSFLNGVYSDHDTFPKAPELPSNINDMVNVAEILSEDFPYARVDLYNIKGRILFGEITFYPWSGYVQFTPDSFDYKLGGYFNVNNLTGGYNLIIPVRAADFELQTMAA